MNKSYNTIWMQTLATIYLCRRNLTETWMKYLVLEIEDKFGATFFIGTNCVLRKRLMRSPEKFEDLVFYLWLTKLRYSLMFI